MDVFYIVLLLMVNYNVYLSVYPRFNNPVLNSRHIEKAKLLLL